jgi:hypothetical protein
VASKKKRSKPKARKRRNRAPVRKERPVAKKKRRSPVATRKAKKRRASSFSSSTRAGLIPPKSELYDMAGAAGFGWLESKAVKEKEFVLNKVPRPVDALGFAGNIALAARLVYHLGVRHPALLHFARGTACVAAYQLGSLGRTFEKAENEPGAFKTAKVAMADEPASTSTASTAAPSSTAASTSGFDDDDDEDLDVSGLADEGDAIAGEGEGEDPEVAGEDEDEDPEVEGLDVYSPEGPPAAAEAA